MDLLNMYFPETNTFHPQLERKTRMNSNFISQPYPRSCFYYHQGTEWRRKYFNILVILFRKFLEILASLTPGSSSASSPYPFCISVAWPLMRPSWTTNSWCMEMQCRTHPQPPTHLCTQPTPSHLYTHTTQNVMDWHSWDLWMVAS